MTLPFCNTHKSFKDKICAAENCCLLACDVCYQSHLKQYEHGTSVILNYLSKAFFEEWNQFLIFEFSEIISSMKINGACDIFKKQKVQHEQNKGKDHDENQLIAYVIKVLQNEKNILLGNLDFVKKSYNLLNLTNPSFLQDLYNLVVCPIKNNLQVLQNDLNKEMGNENNEYVFQEDFIQYLSVKKNQIMMKYKYRIVKEYWKSEQERGKILRVRTQKSPIKQKLDHCQSQELKKVRFRQPQNSTAIKLPTISQDFSTTVRKQQKTSPHSTVETDEGFQQIKQKLDFIPQQNQLQTQIKELTEKVNSMLDIKPSQKQQNSLNKVKKAKKNLQKIEIQLEKKNTLIKILETKDGIMNKKLEERQEKLIKLKDENSMKNQLYNELQVTIDTILKEKERQIQQITSTYENKTMQEKEELMNLSSEIQKLNAKISEMHEEINVLKEKSLRIQDQKVLLESKLKDSIDVPSSNVDDIEKIKQLTRTIEAQGQKIKELQQNDKVRTNKLEEIQDINQNLFEKIKDITQSNEIQFKKIQESALSQKEMDANKIKQLTEVNENLFEKIRSITEENESQQLNEENQIQFEKIEELATINETLFKKVKEQGVENQKLLQWVKEHENKQPTYDYDEILMIQVIELEAMLKNKNTDIEKLLKLFNELVNIVDEKPREYYISQIKKIKGVNYVCA